MTEFDKHIVAIDAKITALQSELAQASETSQGGTSTRDRLDSAFTVGSFVFGAIRLLGATVTISNPASLAIVLSSAAAGAFGPDIIDAIFGKDKGNIRKSFEERLGELRRGGAGASGQTTEILRIELEKLRRDIADDAEITQQNIDRLRGQSELTAGGIFKGTGLSESFLKANEPQLQILRDELIVLQELRDRTAIALQQLAQKNEEPSLLDCLQRLCERLDELGLQGSGGRSGLVGGAGDDKLGGGPGGGRIIPASFIPTGGTAFGNSGLGDLNRELAESAWRVQDLSTGFKEAEVTAGDFGVETRSLNGLLEQSNLQFNKQTGLIGALRELVPELGGDFVKIFDESTEHGRELNSAIQDLGVGFLNTFGNAIIEGKNLSGVLKGLLRDILRLAQSNLQSDDGGIFGKLFSFLGGGFPGGGTSLPAISGPTAGIGAIGGIGGIGAPTGIAKGGVFDKGKLQAFAAGGVLDRPTLFPMADGMGLAGEAGPEAVLPLTRLRGGKLGVGASLPRIPDVPSSAAGSNVNQKVVFNIDARGADRAGLLRLERAIQQINGSLERRAVSAVLGNRRRGGAVAKAFGGR